MKVLLLNGSPHAEGCVFTALSEVGTALKKHDVDSEIFQLGNRPIQGCIGCWKCIESGNGCIFKDKLYSSFVDLMQQCDGIVIGSPVYYAGPSGSLCAFLDRVFFSAREHLMEKVGACVVNCRRGGASAAFDRLNKYFSVIQMPIATSQYWNSTHGFTPDDVRQDLEGLQTMRTLGNNMAFLLKSLQKSAIPRPEKEPTVFTNFI